MYPPDPSILLDAWERGLRLPLQRRVVALLASVTPGVSESEIAALPLGVRDAMLLDLRGALFGPSVSALAGCPVCGEQLETQFRLDEVQSFSAEGGPVAPIEAAGHRIDVRPPSTADLLAIADGCDSAAARSILLDRCISARDTDGAPVQGSALPEAALAPVAARIARLDPLAVVDLRLECAACGHGFLAAFDIARYLLRELQAWAGQLLRDIDTLARAYGWREADVLALSPTRRQIYVEMAAG